MKLSKILATSWFAAIFIAFLIIEPILTLFVVGVLAFIAITAAAIIALTDSDEFQI